MHFEIFQREQRSDCYYVAARFWDDVADFRAEKPPVLINDFRWPAMRLTHQRIRRTQGKLIHIDGAEVAATDVRDFLRTEGYQWEHKNGRPLKDGNGRWVPITGKGKPVKPFQLNGEEFDPQWEREVFGVSIDGHIDSEVQAYWRRALARKWSGDRRGTTTVYQVGAGADDGFVNYDDETSTAIGPTTNVGKQGTTRFDAWYRFASVSGLGGATINSAVLSLWGYSEDAGTPKTVMYFDNQASPSAPSSYEDYISRNSSPPIVWNSPGLDTLAFTDSPELQSSLQFLIGTYTPTALQILHKTAPECADENYCDIATYEDDTSHAAKLTVDSSASSPTTFRSPSRRPRPIYQR